MRVTSEQRVTIHEPPGWPFSSGMFAVNYMVMSYQEAAQLARDINDHLMESLGFELGAYDPELMVEESDEG